MTVNGSRPRTVLVVDDDESVLRLLEIKLNRAGFSVETARDGDDGLRRALANPPDVVIAADGLPKRDGHSLVREIVAARLSTSPAIVLLSPQDGSREIERALRDGCDDYVLKPFSPSELVHRLDVAICRRRLMLGEQV